MDTIKGQIKMEQKRIQRLIDLTDLTSAQAPPSALRNTAVPTLLPVLLPQLPLRLQAAPASPRVSSTAVLPPTRLPNGGCICHAPGRSSAAKAVAFKDGRCQAAHQQKKTPRTRHAHTLSCRADRHYPVSSVTYLLSFTTPARIHHQS